MKAISIIMLLITSLFCCGNNNQSEAIHLKYTAAYHSVSDINKDSLNYKILTNSDKTYGYDILKYGKVLIHQECMPGVSGNKGFTSKGNAQKVAVLVIKKIRKGEMPPTVTKEELKKLGVL